MIKRLTLTAACLWLSACGFQPLHMTDSSAPLRAMTLDFGQVKAQGATGDKVEFLLRQSLADRMAAGNSPYVLSLDSSIKRQSLGIRVDDVASRFDLILEVDYQLKDAKTGDVLTEDSVRAVSTFGAPRDPYGRTAAQSNAEERLTAEVTDRMILKLGRYFKSQGQ